jgi:tetratricopeptide (TPR) repeat protein
VRGLLERLLLVEPNDPDLKKALVNVHVKAGDQKRVAELYESIADDLVRQQKPLEAVAYLQKILLIDRSRSDISERVRKLYEFDERSRRRGRALSVLAVLFCLLLVLGSGYWFYNERAEEEFARIDVRELVAREDFAAARAIYDEFVLSHPLTTAVAEGQGRAAGHRGRAAAFEARRDSERADARPRAEALRDEYKAEWQRHRELFLAGNAEESMVALQRVKELVEPGRHRRRHGLGARAAARTQLDRGCATSSPRPPARRGVRRQGRRPTTGKAARTLALRLHSRVREHRGHPRVPAPGEVATRPAGALLCSGGQPLLRTGSTACREQMRPRRWCSARERRCARSAARRASSPALRSRRQGGARVDARARGRRRPPVRLRAPAQTGVGIGDGWVAVGLRGGRSGSCAPTAAAGTCANSPA